MTWKVLFWNIHGFTETKYNNVMPIWKKADIINLVETWEHEENNVRDLNDFIFVGSTWNKRTRQSGSGFGGIATYVKSQLSKLVEVVFYDIGGQYH